MRQLRSHSYDMFENPNLEYNCGHKDLLYDCVMTGHIHLQVRLKATE